MKVELLRSHTIYIGVVSENVKSATVVIARKILFFVLFIYVIPHAEKEICLVTRGSGQQMHPTADKSC